MITRIWHGRTRPEHAEKYLAFLQSDGTREYVQTRGNVSARIWRKDDDDCSHFWTVTEWESIEAVKSFAGEAYQKAKYYPQDAGFLLDFEENVDHYDCVDVSATQCREYMRQLEQLYEGGSWQGESFTGKLRDVNDTMAFQAPVPGVHSIAEIIWHVIYWRTVLIRKLEGDHRYRDETVNELNFLSMEQLKRKGWESLTHEFLETQTHLMDMLAALDDGFLRKECEPGYTHAYFVEGIIHHDLYHLGQIGLVKKILSLSSA